MESFKYIELKGVEPDELQYIWTVYHQPTILLLLLKTWTFYFWSPEHWSWEQVTCRGAVCSRKWHPYLNPPRRGVCHQRRRFYQPLRRPERMASPQVTWWSVLTWRWQMGLLPVKYSRYLLLHCVLYYTCACVLTRLEPKLPVLHSVPTSCPGG